MFTAKSSPEIQWKIKSRGFREPTFLSDIDSKTLGSKSKPMHEWMRQERKKKGRKELKEQLGVTGPGDN